MWGGRPTRAEVNLDAVTHNVRVLRGRSRAAHLMAVVKADAYGHGAVPVSLAALRGGADHLGVYAVEEGLVLRSAGISAPILVFGPFTEPEARLMAAAELTATISSISSAETLQRAAGRVRVGFFLKIDTGLHRAGVAPEEAPAVMRLTSATPYLQPAGIFTHFAAADERDKTSARLQLDTFLNVVAHLAKLGYHFPIRSAANTGALLDLPDAHLDMVRAGIGVYGYHPSEEVERVDLRPALQLVSRVVRVHRIGPGTGVGYGYEFRARREECVALVPIGYGDGLPRSLGNGRGAVLIRGSRFPIIGRVSMDQITVAVTGSDVAPDDGVVLIGRDDAAVQDAEGLGADAGTIAYDILTGLQARVPRLYVRDGAVTAAHTLDGYRELRR